MSFVSDAISDIFGGGDAADASREAAQAQAEGQREALQYLQSIDEPLLDLRGEALPQLAGFYGLGTKGNGAQQEIISQVRSSPFYEANLEQMEEAIMRNQAATGGLRSGDTQSALATESSNLLQGLTNQRLQGLGSFANPNLSTNQIAGTMTGIGQTRAQGITGAAQAEQSALGQGLQTGLGIAGLFI